MDSLNNEKQNNINQIQQIQQQHDSYYFDIHKKKI